MAMFWAMTPVSERLTKARKSAGYETAADAARALGVKPPTYYSHENGSIGLRHQVAEKYAKKFKVSLEWLLTGRGEMTGPQKGEITTSIGAIPYNSQVAGVPLLGSIQAGHWLETTNAEDGGQEMVPVVRDPRFPYARQYALKVVGDSVDLEYPDGSIVTCVDFADSGLQLTDGMLVHVERQRAGGQLIEITLKAVERRKGVIYLVPRSSNPKYVATPLKDLAGDTEIVAKGVVIGGWRTRLVPGSNNT